MNKTLQDYIHYADNVINSISKNKIKLDDLENHVISLQKKIKDIQIVARYMADIANNINEIIISNGKCIKEEKIVDPLPLSGDHAMLRTKYQNETKEIVKNINIPVKIVNKISEIPISELYYVNELKQFAFNINGLIIKGNLANIADYKDLKTYRCEYAGHCKSLKKNIPCNYYHDPEDYISAGLPIIEQTRSFTNGSFIYTKKKLHKTYYNRHIGSKDSLIYDILTIKKMQYVNEIYNREGQLIHDILIYIILHNENLLGKFKYY
jgi:hypothetical protein